MGFESLPYILLLLSVLAARFAFRTRVSLDLFALATLAGVAVGTITLPGVLALILFALLTRLHGEIKGRALRTGFSLAVLVFAIALENYWLPGFYNLRIFDQVRFSSDAVPFTMYLNFDKTAAGLLIYIFHLRAKEAHPWPSGSKRTVALAFVAVVAALMPLALATHYVHFAPKLPNAFTLWALNNLFFVCVAEEALYRGFIQRGLARRLAGRAWGQALAVVIAALLFGLAHARGGFAYVGLATIAGLFYGLTYAKTQRLEAAMLVHFGLNATHVLLFTYPALS